MIPFKIVVFGTEYTIEYKHMEMEGEARPYDRIIYINPDLSLEEKKDTVWHEISHLVQAFKMPYFADTLKEVENPETMTHLIIEGFGYWRQILAENPDLRAFLFN